MRTLGHAWRVIEQNGRTSLSNETKKAIRKFAEDAPASLTRIQRQLSKNAFRFGPATGVAIKKPGSTSIRPIVVASIESRIVQRAILEVLLTVPEIQRFLDSPFSFGGIQKRDGSQLAAVSAAVQATLDGIGRGARFIVRSDIRSFFARIPKPSVTQIVANAVQNPDFLELFELAIAVELQNMVALRAHLDDFPIQEVGVAQGNSLSPLLGNIYLADFDRALNDCGIRCVRYIDDFILLAPSRAAACAALERAKQILHGLGLEVSPEKTGIAAVDRGFQFLGVEFSNGAIRPARKSRRRLLSKVTECLEKGTLAIAAVQAGRPIEKRATVARVLGDVAGIVTGWSNQYRFCNEHNLFAQLDSDVDQLLMSYISRIVPMTQGGSRGARLILGIPAILDVASDPLVWPANMAA